MVSRSKKYSQLPEQGQKQTSFFFFFFTSFIYIYFHWSIITSQCCISFSVQLCESAICIHRFTLFESPPRSPLPSHASRSSQSTGLSSLCYSAASHYFTPGSVYMSRPLCQFVPPSTSPTVSRLYIAEDFVIHSQNRKSKGQIYPTCPHPRPNTPPTAEFGVWPPWQLHCLSLEDSQVHITGRDWNWLWTEKLLCTFDLSNFYQNIYLWIRLRIYCTDSPLVLYH